MADDTKHRSQPGKRPYATLDLKAAEIKITPVSNATQSYAASATRGSPVADTSKSSKSEAIPLPLTPSAYGDDNASATTSQASASGSAASAAGSTVKSNASAAAPRSEPVVVQKRGGFFSHLAAGIVGGVLALAGSEWALPQLGINGTATRPADNTAAISERLQALEAKIAKPSDAAQLGERVAALEKSSERIPALVESQSRLVAETKAALASAANDTGVPEQLTRLATLEERLKALTDAGANNPNAGRLEQIAALTGKVADLETALATQLTALRKGVADDVDARVASVAASAEAAKSGTQRIDRDVATLKNDAAANAERMTALKADTDSLAQSLKAAQDSANALKAQLQVLQSTATKPTDVAAAVKPVGDKLASLEQSVQALQTAETERRSNSERVVLSLELQNLKRALDNGQGYAPELATVAQASSGKFDLAALDTFKDDGVPPPATLAKDFRPVANAAIDAEVEQAEGGVVDRLIAGAKSVVRVRKLNHAPDDKSTEAIVGRMEIALNEGRLEDALTESKQLPPKALESAKPFLDRVAARVSVDRAVNQIEGQLKSSLGAAPEAAPAATP